MARKRRLSSTTAKRGRDNFSIAKALPALPLVLSVPRSNVPSLPVSLIEFEDRRRFHPLGVSAPAKSFTSTRHRLVVPNAKRIIQSKPSRVTQYVHRPHVVAFKAPDRVLVCVRRKIRKEVLHAKRKSGRNGMSRARRNYYSGISC